MPISWKKQVVLPSCWRKFRQLWQPESPKKSVSPSSASVPGGGVDGQVLVIHDMLGINQEFSPRFLRRYHNLYAEISGAVGNYIADVKSGDFPNEREQY